MRSAKKLITAALLVLLCMSLLAVSAFAADGDELPAVPAAPTVVDSGTCGENLTWSLDGAGTLTVSGTGPMYDFDRECAPWWNYRESVTAVVIGEGVTQVGNHAFMECENMTSLSLPGTLEVIRLASFSECNNLRSVTLPDSLTTIEGNAFDCCGMQTITIPRNVTEINSYAFHYCGDLEEILVDENNPVYSDANGVLCNKDQTVVILAPDGLTGSYTIPDTVTMIGGLAFDCCYKLTDVVFGEGVTFIEDSAFYDCANLKNVTFSDSLVTIGFQAFHLCSALDDVTLPASLETIETSAFAHCSSMTEITIPAKVQSIGSLAFNGCRSLTGFGVDAANPWFTADQYGVLFSKDMTKLVAAPGAISGTYVIPDGTVTVGGGAFIFCENLESVTIPEGVTVLGSNAFEQTNLTEVTLPASITEVGTYLFCNCYQLKKVTFLGSAPTFRYDVFDEVTAEVHYPAVDPTWNKDVMHDHSGDLTWVPDGDVLALEAITDLLCYAVDDTINPADIRVNAVFGNNIKVEIAPARLTLGQCDLSTVGLKTLTVSYGGCSVDIKVAVHNRCMGSTSDPGLWPESDHDYGNGLDDIQTLTLSGAEKLVLTFSTQTQLEDSCDFIYLYDGNDNLIASYTGDEASGITVTVPGDTVRVRLTTDVSVTGYGYSFTDIEGRVIAHVGNTPAEDAEPTCTQPGRKGGKYCEICQTVVNYTAIPALGHDYESVVTAPTVNANGYTTYTCTRCGYGYRGDVSEILASGSCGDSLTWLLDDLGNLFISGTGAMHDFGNGNQPWCDYSNLIKSVVIGEGVTTICDSAFHGCFELSDVELPDSLVSIGSYAFCDCQGLTEITIPKNVESIGAFAFGNCDNMGAIYVDEENAYFCSDEFGVLYNKDKTLLVAAPCRLEGHYTIPNTVTEIGTEAFRCCYWLTGITIPQSVTQIGGYAFAYTNLTEITLPEGITVLENHVFLECRNLLSVTLPESLTRIGYAAFSECSSLTGIVIPKNLAYLEDYAFSGCTALESITFQGDAPSWNRPFDNLVITIYYPAGNDTWTEDVRYDYDGNITWIPVGEIAGLEVVTDLLCYAVGDTIDPGDIGILAVYENGATAPVNGSSLELGTCDMTTVGLKTLTVSYGDFSVEIKVAVHEERSVIEVDPSEYPESSHQYECDLDDTQTLTVPGAQKIILTFSQETYTEDNWDYISIYDGSGHEIASYTGGQAAGITLTVPGNTVRIRLTSDGSVTGYGYSFTNIVGEVISHVGDTPVEDVEPTCTESGHTGGIFCQICQAAANYTTIPALGHDYRGVVTEPTPEHDGYTTYTCSRCGDSYMDDVIRVVDYGTCGDGLTWMLDDQGYLTISGTGPMENYEEATSPWYKHSDSIFNIDVGSGVTAIGDYAFYGCVNMEIAYLPESVARIGDHAFHIYSYDGWHRISFLGDAPVISSTAFANTNIICYFGANDTWTEDVFYPAQDAGDLATYGGYVTWVCEEWVLGKCGDNAIAVLDREAEKLTISGKGGLNSNVGGVRMPWDSYSDEIGILEICEGITNINMDNFYGFEYLEEVYLPNSLQSIGEYAFAWCSDLEKIVIPEGVTSIGDCAFAYCHSLNSVTLPSSLREFGNSVFAECYNLVYHEYQGGYYLGMGENPYFLLVGTEESVTSIHEDTRIIGGGAFSSNTTLTGIVIPDGVVSICENAFRECTALTEIVLPDSVSYIGDYAFQGCTALTSVVLSNGLTEIGRYVFEYCENLQCNVFGGGFYLGSEENPYLLLHQVNNTESFAIHQDVKLIEYYVFYDCDSLVEIVLPKGVAWLSEDMFYDCDSLETVTLLGDITVIPYRAFFSCDRLTSVTIPDTVTEIGPLAFARSTSLTGIVLPASVTSIGYNAFNRCSGLTTVYFTGSKAEWEKIAFDDGNECLTGAAIHYNYGKLLDTPSVSKLENLPNGIKITWGAVEGAERYRVFVKTSGGWQVAGDTTGTSFTYTAAKGGQSYIFTVRCIDAKGNFTSDYNTTGWSQKFMLRQPSITKLENVSNGIKITWGAISGAEGYRVFVKTANGWQVAGNTTGTSFTYTAAKSGQSYTFTVRCVDAKGSFTSSYNTTGWGRKYIAQPSITKLENVASGIKITWGAVSGAERYRVFVKTGSSGWQVAGDTTGTSFTYTGAKGGQSYTFTVRCIDTKGSFASSYNTTGWTQKFMLRQPGITKLENVSNGIKITWGAVSGAEGYRVFVKTANGWQVAGNTTGTSFTYTGAKSGQSYIFTVRCVDAKGSFTSSYNTTGWSQKYIGQPKVSKLENVSNGIKITWGAVSGAERYRVFVKTSSGWQSIGSTTGTSFVYTGAKSGQTYTFTVRCVNAADKVFTSSYNGSGWSQKYIAQPSITKLQNVSGGIKLTWNAVSGAERYRVFVKTSSGWQSVGSTTGTSFTYTGAKSGQTYTFTVRCVNAADKVFTSSYNKTGWAFKKS